MVEKDPRTLRREQALRANLRRRKEGEASSAAASEGHDAAETVAEPQDRRSGNL